ncbi:hypothetical protein DFH07DRAFT_775953 [Mycena maculata]|uniref:Uncharacterized protein n=1 Tax=Mycena maculata TaxID=230809 RepID=A0AAD7IS28_9AGAR|nr:hypothetical protein DFH07DRAFT_775953 [Mycena maculata]
MRTEKLRLVEEDYEDLYGKYIRDADLPAAIAERDSQLDSLIQCHPVIALTANTPLSDSETIWDYTRDRDAYEAKYKMSADVDDDWHEVVDFKCAAITFYEELMTKASDLAGKDVHFCVVNPFPLNDEHRIVLDHQLRGWLLRSRRDDFDISTFPPTVGLPTWKFQMPNVYPEYSLSRLEYFCFRKVFQERVEAKMAAANADAKWGKPTPSVIAPSMFYCKDFIVPGVYVLLQGFHFVVYALPRHSDKWGFVYEYLTFANDDDDDDDEAIVLKCGRTKHPWRRQCRGSVSASSIAGKYCSQRSSDAEAILHMHFKLANTWLGPIKCDFCPRYHWEKFDYEAISGLEGFVGVVEGYLDCLGWPKHLIIPHIPSY